MLQCQFTQVWLVCCLPTLLAGSMAYSARPCCVSRPAAFPWCEEHARGSMECHIVDCGSVRRLDRCFLELMQDGEEAFLNFRRVVESANVIMATYADELLGDTAVGHLGPLFH